MPRSRVKERKGYEGVKADDESVEEPVVLVFI
jgi:hypothetical protein